MRDDTRPVVPTQPVTSPGRDPEIAAAGGAATAAHAPSLSRRVVRAGSWSFGLHVSLRIVRTVRTVVLVRLLAPDDFGLMGIALVALSFLETFSITGFKHALIQRREDIRRYLDTAWTVELIRNVLIAGALLGGAPVVAALFKTPEALPIVRAIAIAVLIGGFVNIGVVYFERELEFHKRFVFELAQTLAEVVVGVAAALVTRSVWALVFGVVAARAVRVVASYLLHPYRPRPELDLGKARELYGFGKWVFRSDSVLYLLNNLDYVVVGRVLGAAALGLYKMAFTFSQLVATELTMVTSRVTFPAYSKLQGDLPRLRRAYQRTLHLIALSAFPVAVGSAVLSERFAEVVLGEAWTPMASAMALLCLAGLTRSLASTTGSLLRAIGRPATVAGLSFARLVVFAPTVLVFTVRWGLTGAAWSVLGSSLVVHWASLDLSARAIGLPRRSLLGVIALPAVNSAAMAIVVALTDSWLATRSGVLALVGGVIAGGFVYALLTVGAFLLVGYDAGGLLRAVADRLRGLRAPRPGPVVGT
ncbi:MAG TPA: lipopolysaccharide biosynthesis protein [Nitriliruptorales bacterium]|nr:lipopolysaccharide biosynthesis protein [Nitriliruptorales bacterium]